MSDASRASTESPPNNGSNDTRAEAANAFPCPSCTVWNKSTLWNEGLFVASCISRRVKQASIAHGIGAGGMVCKNAAFGDLALYIPFRFHYRPYRVSTAK